MWCPGSGGVLDLSIPLFLTSSFLLYCFSAGQEYGASTSLNDFLRQSRASMGTKVMCKQGGCGICIVEAKMQLSPSQPKVSATVNSVGLSYVVVC